MVTREELRALDKEQLIDLILLQQETIARQQELIARLEARVAELEAKLDALMRPPKTPDTSSLPPSTGHKPNRAERRRSERQAKRGPKHGHQGQSRLRQQPDRIVRCHPTICGGCGEALNARGQRRVRRSQVVELVPAKSLVIEAWCYQGRCSACGVTTTASHPPGLEPHRTFGPELETTIVYLHERHHLSYERLVEVCRDALGVTISEGAIAAVVARLAARAKPAYDQIREQVRGSPVIGSDETGARVDGRNCWHWVFQTDEASYHVIDATRAGRVIDRFLDGVEPEVWCSDANPAQVGTPATAGQLCLAHQLRELLYVIEADRREGPWARQLHHVFARAMRVHRERVADGPERYARRRTRVVNAARRLVFGPPLARGDARRLQRRYQRHWEGLFVFLEREDVEPTNNASERDLRNSVIHRKVTGGYRSWWGANASAVTTSILQTARKQGENLYAALRSVAGPSPIDALQPS